MIRKRLSFTQNYSFSLKAGGLVLFSSLAGSISLFIFSPHILPCQKREHSGSITSWEHLVQMIILILWFNIQWFMAMYKTNEAHRLLEVPEGLRIWLNSFRNESVGTGV